jgi:RND superfamily putative drug exporter
VRSVLVTALTLDVGRWMWWPSALAKRHDEPELPTTDQAEGVRLPVPRREGQAGISPSADRSPGPRGP